MSIVIESEFETVTLANLQNMPIGVRDRLAFGLIGIDADGIARVYNNTESILAGLEPETVIGHNFFQAVAQCMNNDLVAKRFEDESQLDVIIPFVLSLRMRPTKVRLRLLADESQPLRFILIER